MQIDGISRDMSPSSVHDDRVVYSLVIPVLNERETLPELRRRLVSTMTELDGPCEVILVDDGSTDGSSELMRAMTIEDPRFKLVRLSRNFGHQIALTAGLDHAHGDAVIMMDADLQDPPELVPELVQRWREGNKVVYAVRVERAGESRMKLATARWFYRIMGSLSEVEIPADAGDFRLVDRVALDAVTAMGEHRRYLRGMFAWVGYDQVGVHYARDARHAGRTKFSFRRMISFAVDGIVSFSSAPLRLTLNVGFLMSVVSVLAGLGAVVLKVSGYDLIPGWASIVVGITFFSGVQLTVLGVIGEYIARIYEEVKKRPLYLVEEACGFEAGSTPPPRVAVAGRPAPDRVQPAGSR
jgi:dolichol-phosphate mannosyltransferase